MDVTIRCINSQSYLKVMYIYVRMICRYIFLTNLIHIYLYVCFIFLFFFKVLYKYSLGSKEATVPKHLKHLVTQCSFKFSKFYECLEVLLNNGANTNATILFSENWRLHPLGVLCTSNEEEYYNRRYLFVCDKNVIAY